MLFRSIDFELWELLSCSLLMQEILCHRINYYMIKSKGSVRFHWIILSVCLKFQNVSWNSQQNSGQILGGISGGKCPLPKLPTVAPEEQWIKWVVGGGTSVKKVMEVVMIPWSLAPNFLLRHKWTLFFSISLTSNYSLLCSSIHSCVKINLKFTFPKQFYSQNFQREDSWPVRPFTYIIPQILNKSKFH